MKDCSNEWNAMHKPWVRMLNASIYQKLLHVADHLEYFVAQTPGVGDVEVVLKPELHLGRIYVTIPDLEILPSGLLQTIAENADACEVYEISGGEQRLCVTFHRIFFAI